jgi:ribosomal protein S18 acetylase RimI-like enzyme
MLTKTELKQFCVELKRNKYINVLHEVKLEHNTDDDGTIYVHLNVIKIKKPERNLGWGTKIMSDIVKFADEQNVRIELYASNIFGSNTERLFEFYERQGFSRIIGDRDGKMFRLPRKKT